MFADSFYYDPRASQEEGKRSAPKVSAVSELNSIALLDNSGSTAGEIFAGERNMATQFNVKSLATWATTSVYYPNTPTAQKITAGGGTEPQCIFKNWEVLKALHEANFIVFATDGVVGKADIEDFSKKTSDNFSHPALILCVLVGYKSTKPSLLDISVFAPLMAFPNTMVLHLEPASMRYSLVFISDALRAPLREQLPSCALDEDFELATAPWSKVPAITAADILQLRLQYNPDGRQALPDGFRLLPNGMAICMHRLLLDTTVLTTQEWEFLAESMPAIGLLAKNEQKIPELRKFIESQQATLNEESILIKSNVATVHNDSILKIRAQINDVTAALCQSVEVKETDLYAMSLKRETLASLRLANKAGLALIERELNSNPRFAIIQDQLNQIQSWLRILQNYEASSYSVSDITMNLGNRAKRAKVLAVATAEDIEAVDYDGAPKIECSICLDDESSGCLIFRADPAEKKTAVELNGQDYCMNFPLVCGRQNLVFVSSDTVCIKCAEYFVQHGGKDTVRSTISGVLPVIRLHTEANRKYMYNVLSQVLAGGKALPHLFLLLFSLLDAIETKAWALDKTLLIDFLLDELLTHTRATNNFRQDGSKMTLRAAIQSISEQEDNVELFRQPLTAVFVILRHSSARLNNAMRAGKLRLKYFRTLVERYCHAICPSSDVAEENEKREQRMLRRLLEALYVCTPNGIPLYHSGRIVSLNPETEPKILEVLMPFQEEVLAEWDRMIQLRLVESEPMLKPTAVTQLLSKLIALPYNSVENTLDHLTIFEDLVDLHQAALPPEQVILALNKRLFQNLPEYKEQHDHSHVALDELPAFATIYGPSTLRCVCGYPFLIVNSSSDPDAQPPDVLTEDHIVQIKKTRAEHFARIYGSEYPSATSVHVNLHRTAASVVMDMFPLDDLKIEIPLAPTRAMVLAALKILYARSIDARHGNVFRLEIPIHVALALRDFLREWNETRNGMSILPARMQFFPSRVSFAGKVNLEWENKSTPEHNLKATEEDYKLCSPLTAEETEFVLPRVKLLRRVE